MEKLQLKHRAARQSTTRIGDFRAACMNESAIDAASTHELAPELRWIDAIQSKRGLADVLAHLHMTLPGAWRIDSNQTPVAFFSFTSLQDFDDASAVVRAIDQGGMGRHVVSFTSRRNLQSADIRSKYRSHISKLLALSGESKEKATMDAETPGWHACDVACALLA
jgi:putative endopeptidase